MKGVSSNRILLATFVGAFLTLSVAVLSFVVMRKDEPEASRRPKSREKVEQLAGVVAVSTPQMSGDIWLKNVTDQSGITFTHTHGGSGDRYIVETVTAGLALFDYDGDGLIDVYLLNGAPMPPAAPDANVTNTLYRNLGDLRFVDVTDMAGVADSGFGLGVCVGDYDSDGYADLYVNNYGPNVLYHNNGDGTFTDVTQKAGVGCGRLVGAGACFLDHDSDGDLDLYVSNYLEFEPSNNVKRTTDGFPSYPGPMDYEPVEDVLYRNDGDGTFTDVSETAGIAQVAGKGMGMVCADYDNDRDTDVFVVNDEMENYLFQNDGSGCFQELGVNLGLAYNLQGIPLGNMGVDCADYDNDGLLDFFSTSFSREMPVLYQNADGFFQDVTLAACAGVDCLPHVNWGTGFADFDNDRDRDLFIAVGHIDEDVHHWDPHTAHRVPNLLLKNSGDGRFVDVSGRCGDGLEPVECSRGTGLDDLDNDGDIDVIVLNSNAGVTVLRNDSPRKNHWLQVQLRGKSTNRDGIGAQVRVTTRNGIQLDEVHSGRGYQSHHGTRLHFGLGGVAKVDEIEVRWIGGGTDVLHDVDVDQCVVIMEDR